MLKILLLGKNGQVGWECQRSLANMGELISLGRSQVDFSQPEILSQVVEQIRPNFIINAAAYTAVDRAELDQQNAFLINRSAPAVLAHAAKEIDATLLHYSTDYVFDGSGEHFHRPNEATGPLNVYGLSKLAGEQEILASGCKSVILRTSWVYGLKGNNFFKTILRLAKDKETLNIVADQTGTPTSAALIADTTAHIVNTLSNVSSSPQHYGVFHLTAKGVTNWHHYAQHVVRSALNAGANLTLTPDHIFPITSVEYPVPAKRPLNSRLSVEKLEKAFQLKMPAWQEHLDYTLGIWNQLYGS